MPVKRRIAKLRSADLPTGVLELLLGRELPFGSNPFIVHLPRPHWRAWWESEVGAEALRIWTRRTPGTRPQSWWRHCAPEPRKEITNGARLLESEAAFLRRHELLSPEEAARLRPEDFEPVPLPVEDASLT